VLGQALKLILSFQKLKNPDKWCIIKYVHLNNKWSI